MKCEYCSKEHNGEYGSGRFCSPQCARGFSTKAKRKEINKKVSKKISERNKEWFRNGWIPPIFTEEVRKKTLKALRDANKKRFAKLAEKKTKMFVKQGRDILDITYGELEQYRKEHPVCEICGKEERACSNGKDKDNLCIDHCHNSKRFRGLLCTSCNSKLGWFENNQESVLKYLGLVL